MRSEHGVPAPRAAAATGRAGRPAGPALDQEEKLLTEAGATAGIAYLRGPPRGWKSAPIRTGKLMIRRLSCRLTRGGRRRGPPGGSPVPIGSELSLSGSLLAMLRAPAELKPPSLEVIRKTARLLVIDDQTFTPQRLFTRDGYHVERWSKVENVSQLTDDHFDLILLDLHGVGLSESPERQGLGILQHVKQTNPTQLVIAYSAQPWNITNRDYFALADAVFEKGDDYLAYKKKVDDLLLRRYSVGYFIAKMNQELGDVAASSPKAVAKALAAIRRGSTSQLRSYLEKSIQDKGTIDRVIAIIGIAIKIIRMASAN